MKKILSVNFDGGFALAETENQMIEATKYGSNLLIRDFDSLPSACFAACQEHVKRELKNAPYRQIYLPRLDDMTVRPIFYLADFLPCVIAPRLFAAVNKNFVAIIDDLPSLLEFVQQVENFEIREVYSTLEAQRFIEGKFYEAILPFGAYIDVPIPRCSTIPRNTIVQLFYEEWWQKNVAGNQKIGEIFPTNLPFLNSPV